MPLFWPKSNASNFCEIDENPFAIPTSYKHKSDIYLALIYALMYCQSATFPLQCLRFVINLKKFSPYPNLRDMFWE